MTLPVISVRNATTEYSGMYSCTVTNRVGSDQCLLRLDVVPRKYPLFVSCDDVCFVLFYTASFGSVSKCVLRARGCQRLAEHSVAQLLAILSYRKEKNPTVLIKFSLL